MTNAQTNKRPPVPQHQDRPKPAPDLSETETLDDELEESFPASDPPSSTAPGHKDPDEDKPIKAALPDAAS